MSMTEELAKRVSTLDKNICDLEKAKNNINKRILALKKEKEEVNLKLYLCHFRNRPDCSEWAGKTYPWSKKVDQILKDSFKFKDFRPSQLAGINAVLSGKDVILIMPTGGGKSLVYQLTSIINPGLSVVISPLIALIEDQLMALKKLGITAGTINSTMTVNKKKEIICQVKSAKLNILFVTPEYLAKTKIFFNHLINLYKEKRLCRFVIDEVHCCSQWGHDFRTDYLALSVLKLQFPSVPILGLTATATASVVADIQSILQIPRAVILTAPYDRPNLYYEVVQKSDEKATQLAYLEYMLKNKFKGQSGIVYVGTQRECEVIALSLKEKDIRVAPYHANLEPETKSRIHRKWIENYYHVIVATIAFGMGIDKADVRFVIHYSVPKSIESYYQETGRGGRDGQKSYCILMFNLSDWLRNFALTKSSTEEKSVDEMLRFAIDAQTCRRKLIAIAFEDDTKVDSCNEMCDHCVNISKPILTHDIMKCFSDIVNIINNSTKVEVNLTLKKLLNSWFQVGPKTLQNTGAKPRFSREQAVHIIGFLLNNKYLTVKRGYSLVSALAYIDVNSKPLFDVKRTGDKILMPYAGQIQGVPVSFEKKNGFRVSKNAELNRPGPSNVSDLIVLDYSNSTKDSAINSFIKRPKFDSYSDNSSDSD